MAHRLVFFLNWLLCEMLTPATTVIIWITLEAVIGQEFRFYGYDAFFQKFRYHDEINLPEFLFPSSATCQVRHSGASGTHVIKDSICYFPCSSVYQVAFVAVW